MYGVILAGGGGTRLWPLSLPDRPKPFLPLLGAESLIERTAARLDGLIDRADLTVVTERRYQGLVNEQLPGVRVLVEPRGRNTAAAVALATLAIERPEDEVMLVLPADHTIADEDGYRRVVSAAHDELAGGALGVEDPLVTLGVEVTRPATEYGYLIPDLSRRQGAPEHRLTAYVLKAFEEKPTTVRAAALRGEPGVAWNAGMFMWRRRAIRAALAKYAGGLLDTLESGLTSDVMLEGTYERIQPVSIDFAVMEGAAADRRVLMGAMDVGWSDLGTWGSLVAALTGDYAEPARVIAPGEEISLGEADLLVRRDAGRLILEHGPTATMRSEQPMGYLPQAAGHAGAVTDLLERVQRQEVRA
jgi:mannose-1-phosphate guanylyltransferase